MEPASINARPRHAAAEPSKSFIRFNDIVLPDLDSSYTLLNKKADHLYPNSKDINKNSAK